MSGTELGPGEIQLLTETMRELKDAVKDLRGEIASTYVRKDVMDPQLAEIRRDVAAHSDWLSWAQRIIIGAVMVALLSYVVIQNRGTV